MNFTKEMVDDLAYKLLIQLNDEENKLVLDEFLEIQKCMNLIQEIPDLEHVEPLAYSFALESASLREDDAISELAQEEVLCNADHKNLTSIIVPKVVG